MRFNFFKPKEINIGLPALYSVKNVLPPMFKNVIVLGCIEKQNVLLQYWEARRWSMEHCSSDKERSGEKVGWGWYTPCDGWVKDVTHWFWVPIEIPALK